MADSPRQRQNSDGRSDNALQQQSSEELAPRRQTSPGVDLDPGNTAMLNLYCAWSINFLSAIDGTVSLPSLWKYVQSLGGSHHSYGMCITAFPAARVAFMGVFGTWTDMRPYKEVFTAGLMISMLASLLYSAAPALGLWAIVASRALLGAMSAQSVATQAFVSRNTSLADRTRYMSINVMVTNTMKLAGPAFNLFLVLLPHFEIRVGSREWVFNSYTWVGYFLFCAQLATLTFIFFCFCEPPRQAYRQPPPLGPLGEALTLGGCFPYMRVWVDRWLHKTGSWYILVNNFRNSYTANAVNYVVPVITDRDYGWGQLKNSYVFVTLSLESLVSTAILGRASKTVNDRTLLAIWGIFAHTGLAAYAAFSGFGAKAIPVPLFIACLVWYDFGTCFAPTQALYSKLIGKGNAGLYFSVLQSNGAVSNVVAGQLVGLAYGSLGAPCLWAATNGLWALSWVATCGMWRKLHPEYIKNMHDSLGDPTSQTRTLSLQPMGG